MGQNHGGLIGGAEAFAIERLTGKGHDFLDATRDDAVWSKTKEKVSKVGGTVALGLLTEIAGAIAKSMMGLD